MGWYFFEGMHKHSSANDDVTSAANVRFLGSDHFAWMTLELQLKFLCAIFFSEYPDVGSRPTLARDVELRSDTILVRPVVAASIANTIPVDEDDVKDCRTVDHEDAFLTRVARSQTGAAVPDVVVQRDRDALGTDFDVNVRSFTFIHARTRAFVFPAHAPAYLYIHSLAEPC